MPDKSQKMAGGARQNFARPVAYSYAIVPCRAVPAHAGSTTGICSTMALKVLLYYIISSFPNLLNGAAVTFSRSELIFTKCPGYGEGARRTAGAFI